MARLYLIVGLVAVTTLGWADYRGVGLFDDTANSSPTRLGPGQRGTFHK